MSDLRSIPIYANIDHSQTKSSTYVTGGYFPATPTDPQSSCLGWLSSTDGRFTVVDCCTGALISAWRLPATVLHAVRLSRSTGADLLVLGTSSSTLCVVTLARQQHQPHQASHTLFTLPVDAAVTCLYAHTDGAVYAGMCGGRIMRVSNLPECVSANSCAPRLSCKLVDIPSSDGASCTECETDHLAIQDLSSQIKSVLFDGVFFYCHPDGRLLSRLVEVAVSIVAWFSAQVDFFFVGYSFGCFQLFTESVSPNNLARWTLIHSSKYEPDLPPLHSACVLLPDNDPLTHVYLCVVLGDCSVQPHSRTEQKSRACPVGACTSPLLLLYSLSFHANIGSSLASVSLLHRPNALKSISLPFACEITARADSSSASCAVEESPPVGHLLGPIGVDTRHSTRCVIAYSQQVAAAVARWRSRVLVFDLSLWYVAHMPNTDQCSVSGNRPHSTHFVRKFDIACAPHSVMSVACRRPPASDTVLYLLSARAAHSLPIYSCERLLFTHLQTHVGAFFSDQGAISVYQRARCHGLVYSLSSGAQLDVEDCRDSVLELLWRHEEFRLLAQLLAHSCTIRDRFLLDWLYDRCMGLLAQFDATYMNALTVAGDLGTERCSTVVAECSTCLPWLDGLQHIFLSLQSTAPSSEYQSQLAQQSQQVMVSDFTDFMHVLKLRLLFARVVCWLFSHPALIARLHSFLSESWHSHASHRPLPMLNHLMNRIGRDRLPDDWELHYPPQSVNDFLLLFLIPAVSRADKFSLAYYLLLDTLQRAPSHADQAALRSYTTMSALTVCQLKSVCVAWYLDNGMPELAAECLFKYLCAQETTLDVCFWRCVLSAFVYQQHSALALRVVELFNDHLMFLNEDDIRLYLFILLDNSLWSNAVSEERVRRADQDDGRMFRWLLAEVQAREKLSELVCLHMDPMQIELFERFLLKIECSELLLIFYLHRGMFSKLVTLGSSHKRLDMVGQALRLLPAALVSNHSRTDCELSSPDSMLDYTVGRISSIPSHANQERITSSLHRTDHTRQIFNKIRENSLFDNRMTYSKCTPNSVKSKQNTPNTTKCSIDQRYLKLLNTPPVPSIMKRKRRSSILTRSILKSHEAYVARNGCEYDGGTPSKCLRFEGLSPEGQSFCCVEADDVEIFSSPMGDLDPNTLITNGDPIEEDHSESPICQGSAVSEKDADQVCPNKSPPLLTIFTPGNTPVVAKNKPIMKKHRITRSKIESNDRLTIPDSFLSDDIPIARLFSPGKTPVFRRSKRQSSKQSISTTSSYIIPSTEKNDLLHSSSLMDNSDNYCSTLPNSDSSHIDLKSIAGKKVFDFKTSLERQRSGLRKNTSIQPSVKHISDRPSEANNVSSICLTALSAGRRRNRSAEPSLIIYTPRKTRRTRADSDASECSRDDHQVSSNDTSSQPEASGRQHRRRSLRSASIDPPDSVSKHDSLALVSPPSVKKRRYSSAEPYLGLTPVRRSERLLNRSGAGQDSPASATAREPCKTAHAKLQTIPERSAGETDKGNTSRRKNKRLSLV